MAREKDKAKGVNCYLSLRELRLEMPRVLKEIEKGKSFVVIRRSRPVFRIGPLHKQ